MQNVIIKLFQVHQEREACQQIDGANILMKYNKTTLEVQIYSRKDCKY